MRRISLHPWIVPLALLALVLLTYGLFIPLLGLYGDDWPYMWVNHVFGPAGYIRFVAWDRPFSAWIYLLATPVLGERVWAYHLFLALLRWLDAVLLWWVVGLVWPPRKTAALIAAFLLVVYPGFLQQPIPLEFMLHFSVLALFLLSLGMMLKAACSPRRFWPLTAAALVGQAGIFSLEYFFGLELLRPVFLWIVLAGSEPDPKRRVWLVLRKWLPYLVVLAAFVSWRVFVFKFPSYGPTFLTQLAAHPAAALIELTGRILVDLKTVTVNAWMNVLDLPAGRRSLLVWGAVAIAAAALAAVALWLVQRGQTGKPRRNLGLLLVGVFALLAAGWPFWITGLPVQVTFPWDRSTLAFMPGASILAAGAIDLVNPRGRILLLAVLVGLAAGFQAQNALAYRTESNKLQDFFWQLAWRAPGLKPGTVILSEQIPLWYYGDNGLTPPLNWTYAPRQSTGALVYNFFDVDERLGGTLPALKEGLPIKRSYRSFSFSGSTSDILMVFARPGSCLRVLSEADSDLPGLPPKLSSALSLSKPERIQVDASPAAVPPAKQVGAEPEHDWCYSFEKAALANQRGDWQETVRLGDEVLQKKVAPTDRSEWLPFVEGYARVGNLDRAQDLSEKMIGQQANLRPAVCSLWQRVAKDLPAAVNDLRTFNCASS